MNVNVREAGEKILQATPEEFNILRAETKADMSDMRAELYQRRTQADMFLALVALGLVLGGAVGGFALANYVLPQRAPVVNVAPVAPVINVQPAAPVITVQPQVVVPQQPDTGLDVPTPKLSVKDAVVPFEVPAPGIDLSYWKITLPVNDQGLLSGKGDATEVTNLQDFSLPPYFVVQGTSFTFMAPTNSARTDGSNYPRSELREMDGQGEEIEWSVEDGGYLAATLKINELPVTTDQIPGRIVIGQIHGPDDELCRLYYDDGRLYFYDDKAGADLEETQYVLTAADGSEPNIPLGDEFSYSIDVDSKELVVTAIFDGITYRAIDPISSFWRTQKVYFKAGVYVQVGLEGSNAGIVGTGQGSATFSALSRPTHK